jgi:glycosyltransferase involved in cell wall biosynthesis
MLQRAVQSVLKQTYREFRVQIYDDASKDHTPEVAGKLCKQDSRIEYIRRPQNIGQQRNFVEAANCVETSFFSFLPDDDLMLPEFFEVALAGFRAHEEAAMAVLPTLHMAPNGVILDVPLLRWPEGLLRPPEAVLSCVRYGNPGLPSLLIRHQVWTQFEGFDSRTWPSDDLDFELRVTARLPVVVFKKPGGIQVMHKASNTLATGLLDMIWPSWLHIIEKFEQDEAVTPEIRKEVAANLHKRLERVLVTHGVLRSISRGRWEEADRAARLFAQRTDRSESLRLLSVITKLTRALPGSRVLLRGLLCARDALKVARNASLQREFQAYAELLRNTATVG